MDSISLTLSVPVKDSFDLIVCGGGVAGCAAALEGARLGLKTLLLEKSCLLGGLATIGLVNYYEPLCNGRGVQVLRGLAEEFLLLSIRYGYDTLPGVWKNGRPAEKTEVRYQTEFDPYLFGMALCERLTDEGVTILFDCAAAQPVIEGGVCRGVMTDSKSGFAFYACRQLVDATGDSEMAAKAGMPTADGKNYFSYFPRAITLDSCREAAESGRINRAVRTVPGGAANLYGGGQTADMPLYYRLSDPESEAGAVEIPGRGPSEPDADHDAHDAPVPLYPPDRGGLYHDGGRRLPSLPRFRLRHQRLRPEGLSVRGSALRHDEERL